MDTTNMTTLTQDKQWPEVRSDARGGVLAQQTAAVRKSGRLVGFVTITTWLDSGGVRLSLWGSDRDVRMVVSSSEDNVLGAAEAVAQLAGVDVTREAVQELVQACRLAIADVLLRDKRVSEVEEPS